MLQLTLSIYPWFLEVSQPEKGGGMGGGGGGGGRSMQLFYSRPFVGEEVTVRHTGISLFLLIIVWVLLSPPIEHRSRD